MVDLYPIEVANPPRVDARHARISASILSVKRGARDIVVLVLNKKFLDSPHDFIRYVIVAVNGNHVSEVAESNKVKSRNANWKVYLTVKTCILNVAASFGFEVPAKFLVKWRCKRQKTTICSLVVEPDGILPAFRIIM